MNPSKIDLNEQIKNSTHAALITEVKFSSPAMGKIKNISDPVNIAKKMLNGGATALSVLTPVSYTHLRAHET